MEESEDKRSYDAGLGSLWTNTTTVGNRGSGEESEKELAILNDQARRSHAGFCLMRYGEEHYKRLRAEAAVETQIHGNTDSRNKPS